MTTFDCWRNPVRDGATKHRNRPVCITSPDVFAATWINH